MFVFLYLTYVNLNNKWMLETQKSETTLSDI